MLGHAFPIWQAAPRKASLKPDHLSNMATAFPISQAAPRKASLKPDHLKARRPVQQLATAALPSRGRPSADASGNLGNNSAGAATGAERPRRVVLFSVVSNI